MKPKRAKGRQLYLGAYANAQLAARAYDKAALRKWGEDTMTNVSKVRMPDTQGHHPLTDTQCAFEEAAARHATISAPPGFFHVAGFFYSSVFVCAGGFSHASAALSAVSSAHDWASIPGGGHHQMQGLLATEKATARTA